MSVTLTQFNIIQEVTSIPENTLVLVGCALDGPTGTAFMINEGVNPYSFLGKSPLARAFVQAYNSGNSNIILYRINGTYSEATIKYSTTDIFKFRAIAASDKYNTITDDSIYNNIKVYIDGEMLRVTNTLGIDRVYLLSAYNTAQQLGDALNLDAAYGLVEFETTVLQPTFFMNAFTDALSYTAFFTGGSTESNLIPDRSLGVDISATITTLKTRAKVALFGEDPDDQVVGEPNSILGLLDFGGISLVDMFYDDDSEFASILGLFCYSKSFLGQGCIGVLGTTPLYDLTDQSVINYKDRLVRLSPVSVFSPVSNVSGSVVVPQEITPISHIQIVIGDTLIVDGIAELPSPVSLAYSYLATQILNPYYVNMTNKALLGITRINYEFSKEFLDILLLNGYISIVSSIRRGFVSYNAITAIGKQNGSAYRNPHYTRISQYISRLLIINLDDMVGETLGVSSQTGLVDKVKSIIQNLVDNKIIRAYSVNCEFLSSEVRLAVVYTPFTDVASITSVTTLPYNQG